MRKSLEYPGVGTYMVHLRNDQGVSEVAARKTRSRRAGGDRERTRGHELRLYLSLNSLNAKRLA